MDTKQNSRILLNWISSTDPAKIQETLGDVGDQVKLFIADTSAKLDKETIARKLVSAAPNFTGRKYLHFDIASLMRSTAREIRFTA